jgi:hypothetical protein
MQRSNVDPQVFFEVIGDTYRADYPNQESANRYKAINTSKHQLRVISSELKPNGRVQVEYDLSLALELAYRDQS